MKSTTKPTVPTDIIKINEKDIRKAFESLAAKRKDYLKHIEHEYHERLSKNRCVGKYRMHNGFEGKMTEEELKENHAVEFFEEKKTAMASVAKKLF
jgi:hypothetical protein